MILNIQRVWNFKQMHHILSRKVLPFGHQVFVYLSVYLNLNELIFYSHTFASDIYKLMWHSWYTAVQGRVNGSPKEAKTKLISRGPWSWKPVIQANLLNNKCISCTYFLLIYCVHLLPPHWRLCFIACEFVCTSVSNYTYNLIDRFAWNILISH